MDAVTISKWARATGCDRHTMQKAIEAIGIKPTGKVKSGKASGNDTYSVRDLFKAASGGDIKAEQLRKTREEADKIELANARNRGELVAVQDMVRVGEKIFAALRQRILNMPLTEEESDKCLSEVLRLRDRDWSE